MKTYCIEIYREFEALEKIYFQWHERPMDEAIIGHIKRSGYLFYEKYDKFKCYEIEE